VTCLSQVVTKVAEWFIDVVVEQVKLISEM
jgi:hypothetical protein